MSHGWRFPFLKDETGAGTVMGLSFIMLLAGICGLAVDSTDSFRNRAMLEATADAAALAAVIDLPNTHSAIASAVAYSRGNMPVEQFGEVLRPEDVEVGSWNRVYRSFDVDAAEPDAVRVRLTQSAEDATSLNVLRMVGLPSWETEVDAVAQRYIPRCVQNGLVARGMVNISAANEFTGQICIHGQSGVRIEKNNYFEPGVWLSMREIDRQLVISTSDMAASSGLSRALRAQTIDPRMVNHVDEFIADLLAMKPYVTPGYIETSQEVILADPTFDFADLQPGRIYHIQCAANETARIPDNLTLTSVAIVSDCAINVGADVSMRDVVLASRASGKSGNPAPDVGVTFGRGVNLGSADKCQPGGGVQVFSDANVHFSSSMAVNGVQVVAKGDVELGARTAGINGINVQSGGDITLTSRNMFGSCSGGSPRFFPIYYYRLVA